VPGPTKGSKSGKERHKNECGRAMAEARCEGALTWRPFEAQVELKPAYYEEAIHTKDAVR
jgi:hypothetical protein